MDTITCLICGQEVQRRKAGPHKSAHVRQAKARYIYRPGDKHPYEYKSCKGCAKESLIRASQSFCSIRCSRLGANNPGWKGGDAGYMASHGRVYRARGKADRCVFGEHAAPFEWANLLGDHPDVADYAPMCVPCHRNFDQSVAKCFDKKCKRGHTLNSSTMYVKIRNGREVRQCKR